MTESRSIFFVDTDEETRKQLQEVAAIMKVSLQVFSHGESFLRAFKSGPGCLVTELRIQDMSGVELQQRIGDMGSKLPIIFVSEHLETHLIVRALQNGAITVLTKPIGKQEIWDAVSTSLDRDREIRRFDAQQQKLQNRLQSLTSQEKEVLDLMMKGLPNKVIAKRLDVSKRTIESRRHHIFKKTHTDSLADLIKLVISSEWHLP